MLIKEREHFQKDFENSMTNHLSYILSSDYQLSNDTL